MALLLRKAPMGLKESQIHNETTIMHLVWKRKHLDIRRQGTGQHVFELGWKWNTWTWSKVVSVSKVGIPLTPPLR